jgi:hypothetical protein
MEEKLNFFKEKRVLVISISAFVILLSVFIYLIITQLNSLEANASQEQKSKYYTIKQSEPISIEGTIYPKEEQNVSKDLLIGQNETEILVEEGAKVEKDHVLLKVTDTEIQAQVKMNHSKIANLNKDINQKESQINSIKSEINSLETDTQNISRKVDSLSQEITTLSTQAQNQMTITKEKSVTEEVTTDVLPLEEQSQTPPNVENNELEQIYQLTDLAPKTTELETLKGNLEMQKMNLEEKKVEKKVETESLQALRTTKEELSQQNEYLMQKMTTEVTAEQDGTVYFNNQVDKAESNELLKIVSDELIVLSEVSQFDYEEISEGKEVNIRDVVNNGEFKGTVFEKSPLPKNRVTESSAFQLIFSIDGHVQIGYDVIVNYTTDKIFLPLDAIEEDQQGNQYVYLKQKNKDDEKRKITCEKYDNQTCNLTDNTLKIKDQIKLVNIGDNNDRVNQN